MKYNIALIGFGKWAKIVSKEIDKNENFNLRGIVSLSANENDTNVNIYENIEQLLINESIDCLYVAKNPDTNLYILNKIKTKKIPIIFEKPIGNNSKNCLEIINIIRANKIKALTNLPNLYADTFKNTSKFIIENKNKISNIIIYEGGNNLKNKKIHPILDWGIHPMTYFFSFFNSNEIRKIKYKEIYISQNYHSIASKFNIILKNNLEIKIMTGNGFKKKIRKLKIFLDNGDIFINDLINHKIIFNDKIIHKSLNTPLQNLLNNFELIIKNNYDNDMKNLYSSYDSIKLIEKYIY